MRKRERRTRYEELRDEDAEPLHVEFWNEEGKGKSMKKKTWVVEEKGEQSTMEDEKRGRSEGVSQE